MAIKITGPIGQGGAGGAVSSVNGATGAVNIYADNTTLNLAGDGIVVNGAGATSTLDVDSGTTAGKIVKLDGSARLPAVDGTLLTALNVVVDTSPQLGGNLDINGQSIVSASAGNIAITPDTTGSIVLDGLNWPQADGTANQVLKTNGAGQLSFTDPTSGLADVVDDTTPQLGGDLDVNGQSIVSASAGNIAITPDTTGSIVLDGLNWPQADGTTGQVLQTNGAGQLSFTDPTSGLQDVVDDTTPQLGGNLDVNGQSIVSASAGNIAITPDTTGSIVLDGLNWPQADGTANQVLKTNGAGQLSFTDPTSGLQDVVDDTTPQLGGNLDVNGQSIVSASAGNIAITPDTTGSIVLDGLNWPQADGSADQVLKTNGAGQLSFVDQTSGLQDVVDDTTPQLGGNLDVNGNSIVSASAGNIAITPDTTGTIVLDGLNWPQADGTANQVLKTNGAGQLSFTDPTSGLQDVVDDTSPQLGGDLDVQARIITTSTANGSIGLEPDGTGSVVARGTGAGNTPGTVTLNCEQNSHGVALQSPPHSAAASYTLKLPTGVGTSGQALTTDGNNPAQLSWANAGGLADVVDDTTPQLGGNLDVNGHSIVSVSAGNIAITPDTTGSIVLDGLNWPQADGSADQVLKTNGAGQLSFTTLTGGSRPTVTTDTSGTSSTISNPSASTIEDVYLVSNGSNAVTITLPTVTGNSGYKVQVKRLGTASVTVSPASGTIDGAASKIINAQYGALTCCTDGTNWFII